MSNHVFKTLYIAYIMFLKLSFIAGSTDHLYNYLVKETIGGIAQGDRN